MMERTSGPNENDTDDKENQAGGVQDENRLSRLGPQQASNLEPELSEEGYYASDGEEGPVVVEPILENSLQKEDLFATSDEDSEKVQRNLPQELHQRHPFEPGNEHVPLVHSNSMGDVRWASDLESDHYDPRARDTLQGDYRYYDGEERAQRAAVVVGTGSIAVISVVVIVIVSGVSALITIPGTRVFEIQSDWRDGGQIPAKYGCLAGKPGPVSMPVRWVHVPPKTRSIVILLHNPGALQEAAKDPVHWFVLRVPVRYKDDSGIMANYLPANASYASLLPKGSVERPNGGYKNGKYWPPCPRQRTKFVLYAFAVDAKPVIHDFDDAREIINRFGGIPQSKLTGYYGP